MLRVAAVQLTCQDKVADNLLQVGALVAHAAERGAKLVLLPENFAFMGPESAKRPLAEPLGDREAPIQQALFRLARDQRVTLIAGGFPEKSPDPDRPFNTCLVINENGELVAHYRKIH